MTSTDDQTLKTRMDAKLEALEAKMKAKFDSLKYMLEQLFLQKQPTLEPIVTHNRLNHASGSTNIFKDRNKQDLPFHNRCIKGYYDRNQKNSHIKIEFPQCDGVDPIGNGMISLRLLHTEY